MVSDHRDTIATRAHHHRSDIDFDTPNGTSHSTTGKTFGIIAMARREAVAKVPGTILQASGVRRG